MTINQLSDRDREIVDRYRADLLSGAVFSRASVGHLSYIGYRSVTPREDFSALVLRLANFARTSDEAAALAQAILHRIHLYGCKEEMLARAYATAAEEVRAGYDDVVAMAGPNPPRASDAHRPYSLATLLNLSAAIREDSVGWCEAELRKQEGLR